LAGITSNETIELALYGVVAKERCCIKTRDISGPITIGQNNQKQPIIMQREFVLAAQLRQKALEQ